MAILPSPEQRARDALSRGYELCRQRNPANNAHERCDCDLGVTDGCKGRLDAIAEQIVAAERSAREVSIRLAAYAIAMQGTKTMEAVERAIRGEEEAGRE